MADQPPSISKQNANDHPANERTLVLGISIMSVFLILYLMDAVKI